MNYKKIVPAVALTLGVSAQMAAHAATDLFQMAEVSGHGAANVAAAAESKCGAGSCGAAKPSEKKEAAEHKCGAKSDEHKCAGKKDEHKCGTKAEHKCGAKKGEHKCGSKTDEHKCGAKSKDAEHKCAAGSCGSSKK